MVDIAELNQVAFATLGIIAFMLLLAYVLKKVKLSGILSNKNLSLLGTLQIGNKEKILLINVEGKKILIGATPTSIQTLLAIDESNDIENKPQPSFSTTLDNLTSNQGKRDAYNQ